MLKKMIYLFVLLNILFAASILFGINCSANTDMYTYTNEDNNYSIDYPKGWDLTEGSIVIFLGPIKDGVNVNVNVVVEKIPSSIDLEDYAAAGEQQLETTFTNYQKETEYNSVINNEHCVIRVYTWTYQDQDLKQKQAYFVKNKKAYIITCTSSPNTFDEENENYFESMIQSFKIKKDEPDQNILIWILLILVTTILVIIVVMAILLSKRKRKTKGQIYIPLQSVPLQPKQVGYEPGEERKD